MRFILPFFFFPFFPFPPFFLFFFFFLTAAATAFALVWVSEIERRCLPCMELRAFAIFAASDISLLELSSSNASAMAPMFRDVGLRLTLPLPRGNPSPALVVCAAVCLR